ncbi:outer membrane beta-barrel protein [Fulvivirga sp. 29W222]|uniref:Outer membrane beta-barrel protein n=1 Tax=Fulvivirga marina TaxID=2494733 RepID=A0A937KG09_9BACT|nr:outer membrane beta-barrel protein [Fulvivirga marina]MBL6448880.1 outer membrane beta-barrel protein [Fulvivirga marina]
MNRFLLSITLLLIGAVAVNAQEYKPFKLGLGLGYASPSDGGGGVLFEVEPAYRLSDEIAIGLRLGSAAMARAIGATEGSVSGNASYTVNGQYYLSNEKFRPYVGVGVGVFSLASVSSSVTIGGTTATAAASSESKIGFYPRVGFDLGHFNVNIDYNIIGASSPDVVVTGGTGTVEVDDIKNSYLGVRIGAFFFGGRN